jgi:hypothetical protein
MTSFHEWRCLLQIGVRRVYKIVGLLFELDTINSLQTCYLKFVITT